MYSDYSEVSRSTNRHGHVPFCMILTKNEAEITDKVASSEATSTGRAIGSRLCSSPANCCATQYVDRHACVASVTPIFR